MRLLIWLMSRFNVSPELIGDITEDGARRSICWLLGQSSVAIFSTVGTSLWTTKLRTLWAVALGWTFWSAYLLAMQRIFNPQIHPYVLSVSLTIVWAFLVGWIVSRSHPAQPLGANLLFTATAFTMIAPDIARTIETMYVSYPASLSYFWPVLLKLLASNTSFLLATLLGALTGSRRRVA
jgi:hypothetical protein